MITITIKFLSGDVVSIEEERGVYIYELVTRVTTEPLVTFFRDGEILGPEYYIDVDLELNVFVGIFRSVVVYKLLDKIYYTSDTMVRYEYDEEKVNEFSNIYIDYMSFYNFYSGREALCEKLGLGLKEHLSLDDLKYFRSTFLGRKLGSELPVRWADFIKGFQFLLSENIESYVFPDLSSDGKRKLLTAKQWAYYCAFK